jgi:hypothetical protein
MTSLKQIEANRRNGRRSTGPVTEEGKQRSRCNAVRHGLMAETVIGALEDADDYKAFEAAVIAAYEVQTAVERELVLRLASLLWRIRRAGAIETGLFEIQARQLLDFQTRRDHRYAHNVFPKMFARSGDCSDPIEEAETGVNSLPESSSDLFAHPTELAHCFLRLANLPSYPLDRLSRYEATLWRQTAQTIFALEALNRHTRVAPRRRRFPAWR